MTLSIRSSISEAWNRFRARDNDPMVKLDGDPLRRLEKVLEGFDTSRLLKIAGGLGNESAKRKWNRLQGPNGKERLQ